jgi:hypothetical protein
MPTVTHGAPLTAISPSARPAVACSRWSSARARGCLLRLSNGRRLGWWNRRPARADPVLPRLRRRASSVRRGAGARARAAADRADRPGVVHRPPPGRGLLDWPADVAELAVAWAWSGSSSPGRRRPAGWPAPALAGRVSAIAAVSPPRWPTPLPTRLSARRPPRGRRSVAPGSSASPWHWGRGQRRDAEAFFRSGRRHAPPTRRSCRARAAQAPIAARPSCEAAGRCGAVSPAVG